MNPSVAIVDHLEGGHHQGYLRMWHQCLQSQGFIPYIVSPKPVRGVPVDHTFQISQARLRILAGKTGIKASVRLWIETIRWLTELEQSRGMKIDSIAFPYGDPWLLNNIPFWIIDRVNRRPWIGLLFNCPRTMLRRSRWLGLGGIASRRAASIAAFDGLAGFQEWQDSCTTGTRIRLPDVAEPISDRSLVRANELRSELKAMCNNRPVIACVGRIARRKNVVGLIRAIDSWRGPDRPFLLLAGECAELELGDQATLIHEWFLNPSNGRAHWGRIDDDEFDSYISSANMLWACYTNFEGSSNLIAKAAQCETCVLVNPFGAAAEIARSCAHVEVAETNSTDGLQRSIKRCLDRSATTSKVEFANLKARFGVTALHEAITPMTTALLLACRRS